MTNKSTPPSLFQWLTVEILGLVMGLIGLAVLIVGHLNQYHQLDLYRLFQDMYGNIGAGLVDIAITVLIIDRLARRREQISEKKRLIREMGSRDNGTALRAVDELRDRGYLTDGSLRHADLKYANLDGAILSGADLRDAYLSFARLAGADLRNANLQSAILRAADLTGALLLNANLRGAKLLDANLPTANLHGADLAGANLAGADLTEARGLTDYHLARAESLLRALLPTGSRYDGRYNLPADLSSVDTTNPSVVAAHYDIPFEAYQRGQDWARQHPAHLNEGVPKVE